MAITEEFKPASDAISRALRQLDSTQHPAHNLPTWYARAVSSLALLAAKEDVEYATGRYRREAGTAEIVVITTSKFLRAEVSGIESSEPQVSATAWPRTAVTAVSVSAEEGVNSDPRYSEWPGRIDVAFSIGGARLEVPLDRAYSFQESEVLQRILAVELERLVAP